MLLAEGLLQVNPLCLAFQKQEAFYKYQPQLAQKIFWDGMATKYLESWETDI